MSLHIAICDDDPQQCQHLTRLINQWAALRSIPMQVTAYHSADQFLFHDTASPCDLLLLDIEMPGTDGMALAKGLRQQGDPLPIVFITGYSAYMPEGFAVEALHYLLKPVAPEQLYEVLDRYLRRYPPQDLVVLPCTDGLVRIPADEIYYGEAFGKRTQVVCTQNRRYACTQGITGLAALVGDRFVCCHRSYLVHIGHIHMIRKTELVLDGDLTIPLSRRLYDQVSQAFLAYHKERII